MNERDGDRTGHVTLEACVPMNQALYPNTSFFPHTYLELFLSIPPAGLIPSRRMLSPQLNIC